MTLVIRTGGALTSPPVGSKALPTLGVEGIIGRFHADYFTGGHGEPVTSWPDSSMNGNGLTPTATVTASLDTATTTKRAVKLVGSGTFKTLNLPLPLPDVTVGLRIYVTANPTASQFIASITASASMAVLGMTAGSYGARGATGSWLQGAAVAKPGWVTVVATFNAAISAGTVTTNGTRVSGTLDYTGLTADRMLALSGGGHAGGLFLRQAVFLDHEASVGEVATLTSALSAD